jgi:hypothetical protein
LASSQKENLGNRQTDHEPVLPASTLIINEMEQHYFRPGLPTSEYAAVRDTANLLDAANNRIKYNDDLSNERFNDLKTLINRRRKVGVYGKNGEALEEAGLYTERLTEAFIYEEGTRQPIPTLESVTTNARIVFSRISFRIENPPSQPPIQQ